MYQGKTHGELACYNIPTAVYTLAQTLHCDLDKADTLT
jgi:hypothetical protein